MMQELTHAEYSAWVDFYSIHPMGEERADLHAASIAYQVAVTGTDAKHARRLELDDFRLKFAESLPATNEQLEMKALCGFAKAAARFRQHDQAIEQLR